MNTNTRYVHAYSNPSLRLPYLDRPLIKNVEYTDIDSLIKIASPNTVWVEISPIKDVINEKEFNNLYREVCKKARELKWDVRYRKNYKRVFISYIGDAENEVRRNQKIFKEIKNTLPVIQKRGIHTGTSDDKYLMHCAELSAEYNSIHQLSSAYSIINCIARELMELLHKDEEKIRVYL